MPRRRSPPCARPAARATASPAPTSVAVLYFDNVSRDTGDAYIADGLTEELIARLGQIERLQVKSRTAVQRYRGKPIDDPTSLGRTLGVAHLVSGSIRRGSGRIRVTVELTRASTGVRVWGDSYERSSDDLMAVETDVAQAIATGVGGRLAPTEQRVLSARPTTNAEAYDHFLRGSYFIAQRSSVAARRALAEYEAAVQLDPGFARAYGRIGMTYALFLDWGWPFPGLTNDSLLARGNAAAATALRRDSLSADAWVAAGLLRQFDFPTTFAGVESAFRRAIALDPRNADVWHFFGGILATLGRDSAAEAAYRHTLSLDPERAITLENLGFLLNIQRRYAEAKQLVDSGLALDPLAYYLYSDRMIQALTRGDTATARAVAAGMRARPATDYQLQVEPMLAGFEALSGDSTAARARMQRMPTWFRDPAHPTYTEAYYPAMGLVWVGEHNRALDLLESVRPRGLALAYYMRDPAFDPIRNTPRFQRIVAETRPPQ